ncbi:hypothetical protein CDIK_3841 [Cucumispora dikerogammari]|nr:hypothetical protein CDIK_3841 [Cucumispora dikerogammari]
MLCVLDVDVGKKVLYAFETERMMQNLTTYRVLGHIDIDALREQICREYVGVKMTSARFFVGFCVQCQRKTVPNPSVYLTPIVPSYVHKRPMADTLDLSE